MVLAVVAFVAAALVVRMIAGGLLLASFQHQVVSETWVLPYLNMAGPDLAFFLVVGAVFPLAMRRYRLLPSATLAALGFLVGQLALLHFNSSYVVHDLYGYLVLTAPLLGTIVGFGIGVLVSALANHHLQRRDVSS